MREALCRGGYPGGDHRRRHVFASEAAEDWLGCWRRSSSRTARAVRAAALTPFIGGTRRVARRRRRRADGPRSPSRCASGPVLRATAASPRCFEAVHSSAGPARGLLAAGRRAPPDRPAHVGQLLHAAAAAERSACRRCSTGCAAQRDERTRRAGAHPPAGVRRRGRAGAHDPPQQGSGVPGRLPALLWDRTSRKPDRLLFHDDDDDACLDVGGVDGPASTRAVAATGARTPARTCGSPTSRSPARSPGGHVVGAVHQRRPTRRSHRLLFGASRARCAVPEASSRRSPRRRLAASRRGGRGGPASSVGGRAGCPVAARGRPAAGRRRFDRAIDTRGGGRRTRRYPPAADEARAVSSEPEEARARRRATSAGRCRVPGRRRAGAACRGRWPTCRRARVRHAGAPVLETPTSAADLAAELAAHVAEARRVAGRHRRRALVDGAGADGRHPARAAGGRRAAARHRPRDRLGARLRAPAGRRRRPDRRGTAARWPCCCAAPAAGDPLAATPTGSAPLRPARCAASSAAASTRCCGSTATAYLVADYKTNWLGDPARPLTALALPPAAAGEADAARPLPAAGAALLRCPAPLPAVAAAGYDPDGTSAACSTCSCAACAGRDTPRSTAAVRGLRVEAAGRAGGRRCPTCSTREAAA